MNSEQKIPVPSSSIKSKKCREVQISVFTFQLLYIFLDSPSFEPVLYRAQRHLLVSCMLPPANDNKNIAHNYFIQDTWNSSKEKKLLCYGVLQLLQWLDFDTTYEKAWSTLWACSHFPALLYISMASLVQSASTYSFSAI